MAIENGTQNAELGYILDPAFQIEGLNGKPVVGGWICIYEAGTNNKYISYENFDGAQNPFKIPLKSDGRAVILGDPSRTYDVYAYDSYGNQLFSRLNVQCNVPGNISINGADTRIKNTDGTLDVSLRTLGNNVREYTVNTNNKVLDLQEPLYFVENSNTATIIGVSGGGQGGDGDPEVNYLVHANSATWNDVSAKLNTTAFSTVSGNFLTAIPDEYSTKDYVQSSVSSKLDSTAFSTVSGSFLTAHQSLDGLMSAGLLGMSGSTITSYNNMPFPIGGGSECDAEVNQLVHANSADWNNVSAKLDTTAFGTVSGNFLTAHQDISNLLPKNESANFYPMTGNPSSFLTAHQDLSNKLDTTAFSTVSGNFLTAHQDLSDYLTKNSADTLYQPTGDYATHADLTAYQPIGNYADATALDGKVDTSSFTEFSSTTNEKIEYISGALSGTYELSAGEGIDITDYPNEQKTVISVTGYNETVLFSGTSAGYNLSTETTLNESMRNFDRIRFYFGSNVNHGPVIEQNCPVGSNYYFNFAIPGGETNCWVQYAKVSANSDFSKIKLQSVNAINYGAFGSTGSVTLTVATSDNLCRVQKIIGINRIANN